MVLHLHLTQASFILRRHPHPEMQSLRRLSPVRGPPRIAGLQGGAAEVGEALGLHSRTVQGVLPGASWAVEVGVLEIRGSRAIPASRILYLAQCSGPGPDHL